MFSNDSKTLDYQYSPEYRFLFSYEENFDRDGARHWMKRYWAVSLLLGVAYIVGIFALREFMKRREPYKLDASLVLWNCFLAVFSSVGFLRTAPEFFHVLFQYGYRFSVCNSSYADINLVTTCWGFLFAVSKVPELLDTCFIVLRKKPLIFLHYFHHFLTLVVSFYNYSDHPALGRWMMVMNFAVHSVMYSYYALRGMRFNPPRWISMTLTTMQILQMILGLVASIYATKMLLLRYPCSISWDVASIMVLVYGLYFALFVNFFVRNYVIRRVRSICNESPSLVYAAKEMPNSAESLVVDGSSGQNEATPTANGHAKTD